jgi:hypothetical protein
MSELREKIEAWASVANNRAFAFSDAEFGAKEMLALLWPVIEAAVHARDTQCPHYAELKCTCVRDTANIALAALEQALMERG